MNDLLGASYCVDGELVSADEHFVIHGKCDVYYEVIRVKQGRPLFLNDHLERLQNSCRSVKIPVLAKENIADQIQQLIQAEKIKEGNVKIEVCDQPDADEIHLLVYRVKHHYPDKEQYEKGVKVMLSDLSRENPTIKKWNAAVRESANAIKEQESVYEVLLTNQRGQITEGSKSNIFFVKDNTIVTAPDEEVLPGITRQKVLEICDQENIDVEYKALYPDDLKTVDAAFLTGTSPMVLPICSIDDMQLQIQHPTTTKILKKYQKMIGE